MPGARVCPHMPEEACQCCTTADERNGHDARITGRWIDDSEPLAATLPGELQSALGRVLGEGPTATLGEWVAACRRQVGGGSITVEDLCHADGPTGHRGVMDGETYHFQCFYDAVALSALTDRPVDVRTESPDGTVVEARAVGTDELAVSPPDAVFSFGVETAVEPPDDGEPTPADVYAAICPYVRAFPDVEAYETWAETVPAATVAMPLAGATGLAAALVG